MNMKTFSIGVVVLALMVATYFVMSRPATEPVQPATTAPTTSTNTPLETIATTSESNTTSVDPAEIELDLSKLQGKDRLYTEEEGKYENLSGEELKMASKIFYLGLCKGHRLEDRSACDAYLDGTYLIALYSEIAVLYTPVDGSKGMLWIYDLVEQQSIKNYWDTENYAFGPNYIVRRNTNYIAQTREINGSTLELYRPGMADFMQIPNSQIDLPFSYLENLDYATNKLPIEFDGNIITAYIHHYEYDENGPKSDFGGAPLNYELVSKTPITFDLSNLP